MSTLGLEPIVRDYLLEIKHGGKHAETTHSTYQYHMNKFLTWLKGNGYPEPTLDDFTVSVVTRYKYALDQDGYRPRTIRGAFHPLRGLDEYMVRLEITPAAILVAPSGKTRITLPKKDGAVRHTVSNDEVVALFDAAARLRTPKKRAFAKAILTLFCYGGLRRQEALDLNIADVNLRGHYIDVVQGKGSKSRRVFIPDEAEEYLREWLAIRSTACTHTYLLALDTNRRLGSGGLTEFMREIKSHAHVLRDGAIVSLSEGKNIEPHSLRHNAATNWMRSGIDIKTIQKQLGHANITTTSIYLHADEAHQEETRNLGSRMTASFQEKRFTRVNIAKPR